MPDYRGHGGCHHGPRRGRGDLRKRGERGAGTLQLPTSSESNTAEHAINRASQQTSLRGHQI